MERTVYVVEQDLADWVIAREGREVSRWPNPRHAVLRAHALAYNLHVEHGVPTAVEIRYRCGDAMLSGSFG